MQQVHHQKSGVADNIDAAQFVVELDAVEQQEGLIVQDDVTRMQVAVALANKPAFLTRFHQRCEQLLLLLAPGLQCLQLGDQFCIAKQRTDLLEVLIKPVADAARRAKARVGHHRSQLVKTADILGQANDVACADQARIEHPVQHAVFVESAHFDRVLYRRRIGVQLTLSINTHDAEVKLGREATVKA